MYKVEITRFKPTRMTEKCEYRFGAEAWQAIRTIGDDAAVIFAAHIDVEKNVDYGNFYIWQHGEHSFVRLDEHREHYAMDPAQVAAYGAEFPLLEDKKWWFDRVPHHERAEVSFLDEGGETFYVPASHVINTSWAQNAIKHWLVTGDKFPSLYWT